MKSHLLWLAILVAAISARTQLPALGSSIPRSHPTPSSLPIRGGGGRSSTAPPRSLKSTIKTITTPHAPFLYLPNIIGYARVALLIVALSTALSNPSNTMFYYLLSFFMDAVDGMSARWLNQESNLGGLLDMLTDRVATLGLLFVLSHIYPSTYLPYFVFFAALDITSHWARMLESAKRGLHHKAPVKRESLHPFLDKINLVKVYYGNKLFFGYCCLAAEMFWVACYYLAFVEEGSVGWKRGRGFVLYGVGLGWAVKQVTNFQQLLVSCAAFDKV